MADTVLPLKGGWIMVKNHAPVCNHQGRRMYIHPLTILWAMPARIEEAGSRLPSFGRSVIRQSMLETIYRLRRKANVDEYEKLALHRDLRSNNLHPDDIELEMTVSCLVPDGEMRLIPPEWTPIESIDPYLELMDEGHVRMVDFGKMRDGKIGDRMHYIRSRGIPKLDAFKMVAGDIERPGVFLLEVHPGYADYFGLETTEADWAHWEKEAA